ncbi:MAG: adenylate/guanylate cyclase domain-containing protein [Gammaproteobacteria bacterium]|jgi:class 3 adenylate cyclase
MNSTNKFQIFAYYLLGIVVLSIFALRSFNSETSQAGFSLVLSIAAPFLVLGVIRGKLESVFVLTKSIIDRPKRQLILDISLFSFAAAVIVGTQFALQAVSYFLLLKMFVWSMIIGYFASLDSALYRMRDNFNNSEAHNSKLSDNTVPIAHRLNIFLSVTVLMVAISMGLSAYSYMSLDSSAMEQTPIDIRESFIIDTMFILGIIVALATRIIFSYSINVQRLFEYQMDVLKRVEQGDLKRYVPVLSHDEFGVIAQQTNRMIDQLRSKDKIQKTLESIVSPNIMNKLLNGNESALKQGEEYEIAILICDLRKFTTYAENTPPEEVIFFLNAYFAKIADVVAEHNGIINKFMGDAILAVFGIDGGKNYVEQAVDAAWDILMHSSSATMRDGTKFDIGIGVHKGRAAAGTIGSAERFEYTFIGDAVNTASRLDGLSKRLNYKIIISRDVHGCLQRDAQDRFTDLGQQSIRGRSQPIHVFGAVPRDSDSDDKRKDDNVVSLSSKKSGNF